MKYQNDLDSTAPNYGLGGCTCKMSNGTRPQDVCSGFNTRAYKSTRPSFVSVGFVLEISDPLKYTLLKS